MEKNYANLYTITRVCPLKKIEQKSSRFTVDSSTGAGDIMQVSIGQGNTLVTPLQNSFLVAAALNDGKLMKPYLVDRVEDTKGILCQKMLRNRQLSPSQKRKRKH